MLTFHVPDINSPYGVASITEAFARADAHAQVQIDTESKAVRVETAKLDAEAAAMVIAQVGYTVQIDEA